MLSVCVCIVLSDMSLPVVNVLAVDDVGLSDVGKPSTGKYSENSQKRTVNVHVVPSLFIVCQYVHKTRSSIVNLLLIPICYNDNAVATFIAYACRIFT